MFHITPETMDGCNHFVKKMTLYDRMDKTDPPGEAL